MAGIAGSSIFQLGAVLYMQDKAKGAVQSAMKNFESLRKELSENDGALKKLDRSIGAMKLGAGMVAGASVVAGSLMAIRYQTSELEANLRSLDMPADQVDALSSAAGKAASEFGISKETYLQGAYDIKSAVSSLDAGGVEAFAGAVAATARATKGDFAQLSKTFGMVYNQFGEASGLDAGSFAKVTSDVFSAAVKAYRTDGAALEQAFNSAGSSAANLGISLGEQTAVLGSLMNTMTPGEAGTAWKSFTGKIDEGFSKLGISYKGLDGKLLSTADLLTNLKGKFGDSLDPRELAQLNKAFGKEGAKVVLNLIGQTDKLGKAIGQMKDVDGQAMAMAQANLNSVAGQFDRMKFGISAFFDEIAKGSDGPLMYLIGGVNSLLLGFQNLSPETKENIGIVVRWSTILVGAVGAVLFLGGMVNFLTLAMKSNIFVTGAIIAVKKVWAAVQMVLAGKMGILTAAQWLLNAAMMANPIGLIIGLIVISIGVVIIFRKKLMQLVDAFTSTSWSSNLLRSSLGLVLGPLYSMMHLASIVAKYWDKIAGAIGRAYGAVRSFLGLNIGIVKEQATKGIGEIEKAQQKLEKKKEGVSSLLDGIDTAAIYQSVPMQQSIPMPIGNVQNLTNMYSAQKPQEMTKTVNLYFKNLAQNINITGDKKKEATQAGNFLMNIMGQYLETLPQ